jgi:UDP-glucose 4-epimerase
MNILVTGGAGFIGSHLCQGLLGMNHSVTVIDDLSTGNLDNLAFCTKDPSFRFVQGTILDKNVFKKISEPVDLIFHLAAAVGVKYIIDNPLSSIHTNVMGTENILEYAYNNQNIKVVLASTSEVYGKNNNGALRESDDRILGSTHITRWSYACSKALDEFISFAYHRKHGLPIVITRLFNTCGPRQSGAYGMVIPRFIMQALQNEPITVYGTGEQIRSFTYVSDTVEALIQLAFCEDAIGETFNIGGNEPISIKELAILIKKKTHSDSQIVFVPYEKAYETGFEDMLKRVPDINKINALIGFAPRVGLDQILDKTIAHIGNELVIK